MKFTAEPCTLRLLTAVACTAVRPVVPTTGNSNWNPGRDRALGRRDDVEVLERAVDDELDASGDVTGVVGTVVAVLLKTMFWMLLT